MSIILNFLYTYFFEGIALFVTGLITKYLIKQFGIDRAETIKEAVITSMLWAEEVFGIGQGNEKWSKAWQKIIELLQAKGICLTQKEIKIATTLMKSTVPEINQITYSALPETAKKIRSSFIRSIEAIKLLEDLKKKHKVKKK